MRKSSSFSLLIFVVILGSGVAVAYAMNGVSNIFGGHMDHWRSVCPCLRFFLRCSGCGSMEQAVVLRLGKFRSLEGPGVFLIIPMIENIPTGSTLAFLRALSKQKRLSRKTLYGRCGCGVVLEDYRPQEGGPGCS